MKNKVLIGIGIIAILVVVYVILRPFYISWRDKQIVSALESKVLPTVMQNHVTYFVDSTDCKQINYGSTQAASPKGCAYIPNVTDSSKKDIPDFTAADQSLFDKIKADLQGIPFANLNEIIPEYQLVGPNLIPSQEIGLGFRNRNSLSRTRYVYSLNYQKLPSDIEQQVWYTPINQDWFKVDQD